MKKIIILLLIAAAGYWGYKNFGSFTSGSGAFDEQGKPKVLLFTMDSCGQPCTEVAGDLRSRGIPFEEINVMTEEGRSRIEKFGAAQVPFMVVGSRKVVGSDLPAVESALAEAKGMDTLTPAVQQVMRNHFDAQGKPRMVMYGTTWCPYCTKMREYLDGRKVAYLFIDAEGSSDAKVDYATLRGRGYPLIFVGYRRIDGYDESKVDQAVKELL